MPARFSAGIAVVPMMLSPSILVFCTTVPWKPRDCGRETSKPCWFLISTEGRYRSVSLTVLSCRFSIKSCGTDVKENGVSSSLRSPRGPRLTLSAPFWGFVAALWTPAALCEGPPAVGGGGAERRAVRFFFLGASVGLAAADWPCLSVRGFGGSSVTGGRGGDAC